MGSISGQCIVVVHARSLDNGVHTHPIDGGMLTCILQDTSLKWDETPPADTRFIPFASSFLLTKCQVPTRAQNAVMLGGGTDSCQSVPPHRAPAEPPPPAPAAARLIPHLAPFSLILFGRELIGIYVTAPSAWRAISHSLLGRRRRREPAEGAYTFSLPHPLLQFYRLITSIIERGGGGGESGDFNYFI